MTEEESLARHYRYKYAELLELCDKYLGKLLDKFDELDLWKDTMLIVNTDHGYLLGEHGWWSKVVMPCYDEIAHIPLFIHDPRFAADGQRRKEIVQTIREGLKKTGGYCPCRRERTEANKCMCEEFKRQIEDPNFEGYCHCMLYYKSK